MTITRSPLESRVRRRRRRALVMRWAIRLVILGAVFAVGVAVGQALEDGPSSGEPVTSVTEIRPWTQTGP